MLERIPTEDHLARMYDELARLGAACVGEHRPWPYRVKSTEQFFCLGAEMSRYDPRLFGILVAFLDRDWERLNPLSVRSHYRSMSAPQIVAVMAEFLVRQPALPDEKRFFLEYLQAGLSPVSPQLFFQHLYRPGGELMRRATEAPLREYKRWGFLACEAPVLDAARREASGSQDGSSRRNVLLRLFRERGRIRLSDYLTALQRPVSRQQALLDLRSVPGIRLRGRGRGALWELASSKRFEN